MSDTRKLIALFLGVMALGVAVFGVVRGLSETGPASGTRMIVAIAPPVDDDVVAQAEQLARQRLARDARVMPAGDRLVIEIPTQTSSAVDGARVDLERPGAQHPLHVEQAQPFTRETGFLPRARIFLMISAVLLVAAALLWLR